MRVRWVAYVNRMTRRPDKMRFMLTSGTCACPQPANWALELNWVKPVLSRLEFRLKLRRNPIPSAHRNFDRFDQTVSTLSVTMRLLSVALLLLFALWANAESSDPCGDDSDEKDSAMCDFYSQMADEDQDEEAEHIVRKRSADESNFETNFLRFGKDKPGFLRFGRDKPQFLRFGREKPAFLRFGKREKPAFLRFGKREKPAFLRFGKREKPAFLRFGREKPAFLRFGKREDTEEFDTENPAAFLRLAKDEKPNFLRFGKREKPAFLRFGREKPAFLRFGKREKPAFLRFGRDKPAFLRFGKDGKSENQISSASEGQAAHGQH